MPLNTLPSVTPEHILTKYCYAKTFYNIDYAQLKSWKS